MELHNHSSKSARLAKHGKGPRICVEEKGSSTAGLGQRCSSSNCFTFLQLQELQHQLLIYKYIETGLPVPCHLLVPISKSLANSFPALKGLGFIGPLNYYCEYRNSSLEAEPGRCRRTDGKKWRCTKDVVNPDQKYCQTHLHRGGGRRQQQQKKNSRKLALNQSATTSNTNSDTNLSISLPAIN